MKSEKKNIKKKPTIKAINVLKTNNFCDGVIADPEGSYTGVPLDKNQVPVQDVDDL